MKISQGGYPGGNNSMKNNKWGVLIIIVFAGIVFDLSRRELPAITLTLLPFFGLATFRLARTISFNEIGEVIRSPFTKVTADSCGAGKNVEPTGEGLKYKIGSLLACPICSGTWAALILYWLWVVAPSLGQVLVYMLAFAGASEFLHWSAEWFEWGGRAARCVSGLISPDKE